MSIFYQAEDSDPTVDVKVSKATETQNKKYQHLDGSYSLGDKLKLTKVRGLETATYEFSTLDEVKEFAVKYIDSTFAKWEKQGSALVKIHEKLFDRVKTEIQNSYDINDIKEWLSMLCEKTGSFDKWS